MFKKLSAIALVVGITTAGFIATSPTARSADLEEGPCVIAVLKEDPSIRAQRGDCSGVVEAPAEEVKGQTQIIFIGRMLVQDPALAGQRIKVKAVNELSGEVLESHYAGDADESGTFSTVQSDGMGDVAFYDNHTQPASKPFPTYLVTLTVGNKTYTYKYTADLFVNQGTDGDVTTYVAEAPAYLKNGKVSAGYGWQY